MNYRDRENPIQNSNNFLQTSNNPPIIDIIALIAVLVLFGLPALPPAIMANLFPSAERRQIQHASVSVPQSPWASKRMVTRIIPYGRWLQDSDSSYTEGAGAVGVIAVFVDKNNVKWFTTEAGIVSYDGSTWERYDQYDSIPVEGLKGVLCLEDTSRSVLWIASPVGVTMAVLPLNEMGNITTLTPENSGLLDQDVLGLAAGKNSARWIGSRLGISALSKDKWLTPDYQMHYTKNMFREFSVTAMATSPGGDTLYVGTAGAGVARVYQDELDAISGASVIAGWGPIIIPSDNILSVFVAADGARWYGTDQGVARHTGDDLLDNWTVYTVEEGLVDNQVRAICEDLEGNMWFGTGSGISVYNGSSWTSYTIQDGLLSNNVHCIAIDQDGVIWIGTDAGINSYENGGFINY